MPGSPGSGKSTYCRGVQEFLAALRRPNVHIVNLDPANATVPYRASVDINALISVRDVMRELSLGPNGAMLYCIEYLEENFEWLRAKLEELGSEAYVVFDLPGQVELSTNHPSLTRIVKRLEKEAGMRLVAVHLVDATHILDAHRYVSLLLLCLRAMLHLELPHLNVLSKVDLLGPLSGGALPMPLESYTDPDPDEWRAILAGQEGSAGSGEDDDDEEMSEAGPSKPPPRGNLRRRNRYDALNARLVDVIDDFSLVGFETLAVEDKESMYRLVRTVDKVGGWVFVHAGGEGGDDGDDDEEAMPEALRKALEEDEEQRRKAAGEAPPSKSSGTSVRAAEAASALSLFTTLDSGIVPGWGRPEDVEERYVSSYARRQDEMQEDEEDEGEAQKGGNEAAAVEEEFQRQEEQRIYAAYREWKAEQEARGGEGNKAATTLDEQAKAAIERAAASRLGGIEIKERTRASGGGIR